MESVEISKRYAKAFYDFILSDKKELKSAKSVLSEVLGELKIIETILKKEKIIEQFLFSPIVKKNQKALFLKENLDLVLKGKNSHLVKTFLFFLNQKKRLNFLGLIIKALQEIEEKESHSLCVNVYLARESKFSSEEEEEWKKILAQRTQKSVKLNFKNDSSLIGGVKVEMNGFIIENNLSHDLKKLKDHLKTI